MFSIRTTLVPASLVCAMAAATAGCGGGAADNPGSAPTVIVTASPSTSATTSPTPETDQLTTATQYAKAIRRKVGSATEVTTITEATDANNLLGRPNGYTSAAVITDTGGDVSDPAPGVAYGATVEVFTTEAEARRRSDYIQGLLRDSPMLGTEYNYATGGVLLRVSGTLPPSAAKKYESAFNAVN